jgi:hypothetical protein
MVDVRILKAGDASPNADGEYIQVITRQEQEGNPGNIVSDIEHFTLERDGSLQLLARETRDIGFMAAVDEARSYAERHDVPIVYATDRTARDFA